MGQESAIISALIVKKRISIKEYLNTLTDDNFKPYFINGEAYFLHSVDVSERGVGREKLLVSYKAGDEENVRVYVANLMKHGGIGRYPQ